jgi:flagellar biosynthetic protein FlhB
MIELNLQFHAGEKTEKATSKKRRDAREKGQVVQSRDLSTALSFFFVILFLNIFGKYLVNIIFNYSKNVLNSIDKSFLLLDSNGIGKLVNEALLMVLLISLPVAFVALIVGVLITYFQVGFLFTTEPLKMKLSKINPIEGFKRMFSTKSLVELVKSIAKSVLLIYITYLYIKNNIGLYFETVNFESLTVSKILWKTSFDISIRISAVLVILAIADFVVKFFQNEKDLKMTKQEIKDEYKQTEGDPFIKSKIKERQRKMAMSRMMQEVPKADVIITNPTHYAIAINYDKASFSAPRVLAKGQNLIAMNIKKIGEENKIPIVENKPLARALYAQVEIGEQIPEDLFHAVAEVLAYVYKLKKKR